MTSNRLLLVLGVIVVAGCSRDVAITNSVDPSAPATVLLMGEPQAELRGETLALRLPKSHRKANSDGTHTTGCIVDCDSDGPTSVVTVRLATRCGPVEYCVDFSKKGGQGESRGADGPWRGTLMGRFRPPFASCTNEVYRIWVDNRGGAAHLLEVGAIRRQVEAGVADWFYVPAPACPGMGDVALDGAPIAQLPTIADDLDWQAYQDSARDFLVDTGKGRCYGLKVIQYGDAGGYGGEFRQLAPAHWHELDYRVDHFLAPAPNEILTPGGPATRTELQETECDATAPPAPSPD